MSMRPLNRVRQESLQLGKFACLELGAFACGDKDVLPCRQRVYRYAHGIKHIPGREGFVVENDEGVPGDEFRFGDGQAAVDDGSPS